METMFLMRGEEREISDAVANMVAEMAGITPATVSRGIRREVTGCRDVYRRECPGAMFEFQLFEDSNTYGLMISTPNGDHEFMQKAQQLADAYLADYLIQPKQLLQRRTG